MYANPIRLTRDTPAFMRGGGQSSTNGFSAQTRAIQSSLSSLDFDATKLESRATGLAVSQSGVPLMCFSESLHDS